MLGASRIIKEIDSKINRIWHITYLNFSFRDYNYVIPKDTSTSASKSSDRIFLRIWNMYICLPYIRDILLRQVEKLHRSKVHRTAQRKNYVKLYSENEERGAWKRQWK